MIDKVESSTSSTTSSVVAAAESEGEGSEAKAKKLFNYGFLNFLKTGEFHHNNQVSDHVCHIIMYMFIIL